MATALCNKAFAAAPVARPASRRSVVVRAQAQDVSRRAALVGLAGVAALVSAKPSEAAYGQSANVFGKVTNKSGFVPYVGEGFAISLPSKWNPSKELDFANVILRYEDNGDAVNNVIVIAQPTDKKSITDFGAPDKFLESVSYLLGKQSFAGETISEGGFAPNKVAAASLLDVSTSADKKGKAVYNYELLVRAADDNEGGRHHLITATVGSDGKLYICKVQIGDKRWVKGARKEAERAVESFTVV